LEPKRAVELEFCSMLFGTLDGHIVTVCDYHKMMCSMMFGSKLPDVRWDLMRAYALRIETWTNLELRNVISQYIAYLLSVHESELTGSVKVKDTLVSMEQIQSMFKSDNEIKQLYLGFESGAAVKMDLANLSLIINSVLSTPYSNYPILQSLFPSLSFSLL
jgi:hypothetical protein